MSSSPADYSIAPPRDAYRDRRPPYSEDAEQAVLGAMLLDQTAILRAAEYVDDTMFYREGHRRIFRAMVALSERGDIVDPLTLAEELARRGELEASGGKDYVGFVVDAVPTAANVEYHAKIVREKALLRRLIETSTAIVSEAFEGRMAAAELLDEAENRIFRSANSAAPRDSRGSRSCSGPRWSASRRSSAAARPSPESRAGSPTSTK